MKRREDFRVSGEEGKSEEERVTKAAITRTL